MKEVFCLWPECSSLSVLLGKRLKVSLLPFGSIPSHQVGDVEVKGLLFLLT